MRRVLAVSSLTACFLLPLAALAQSTAVPIPDGQVSIAYGPNETLHASWTEGALGSEIIRYATSNAGKWSEPETAVAAPDAVFDLTLLLDDEGRPCIYWSILRWFETCRDETGWTPAVEIANAGVTATFVPAFDPEGEVQAAVYNPPSRISFGDQDLNEGDVVSDPQFAIDENGGYHVLWRNFIDGQGIVWRRSVDQGKTFGPPEFLAGEVPGEMTVGFDDSGRLHLLWGSSNRLFYRQWTEGDGWSPVEEIEIPTSNVLGAVAPDGRVVAVGRTSEGAFNLVRTVGGTWSEPEPIAGTEGRIIDRTIAAVSPDGDITILWHENLAERFNQAVVGQETFRESVPSPTGINLDPLVVAGSVAIAAGTLLLVPFPAELFNSTLAEHHDEILGRFRRRRDGRRFWDRPAGLLVSAVVGAVLYGFLDPSFGINIGSAATAVGLLIGVIVTTLGFALPTMLVRRMGAGDWGRLQALPLALLVGGACVVLSRVIQFQPGYLYGIVIGLAFAHEVDEKHEGREAAISASVVLVVSVAAWIWLGIVRAGAGGGFVGGVLETALVTTMVSGIEALAVGLMPVRGLPGRTLVGWNKKLWIVLWGLSLLLFFHVLVNPEGGYLVDTALVPLATTVALLVGFSVVSVGLWGYFQLRERRMRVRER